MSGWRQPCRLRWRGARAAGAGLAGGRQGRLPVALGLAAVALSVILPPPPAPAVHGDGGPVTTITPEYARRLLAAGDALIFIDLRPGAQHAERLPGARSVPLPELPRRYEEIPRTGRVVLYCACPAEELQAAYRFLRDRGYRNVSILEEGFAGWVRRGYPLER